ncbi:MAG: hypothetical protein AB7F19_02790 [Candidatus Babeliales bacterium]
MKQLLTTLAVILAVISVGNVHALRRLTPSEQKTVSGAAQQQQELIVRPRLGQTVVVTISDAQKNEIKAALIKAFELLSNAAVSLGNKEDARAFTTEMLNSIDFKGKVWDDRFAALPDKADTLPLAK